MTETSEKDAASLSAAAERFVIHWGEMGDRWGVNRTVAQIHALLFLSDRPLPAEQIAATLGVARSNVSTSLKELQGWKLVRKTHLLGDRRDHFETLNDPWDLFLVIVEERKRREIDPTLIMLRETVAHLQEDPTAAPIVKARIKTMLDFMETLDAWYIQMRQLPRKTLLTLIRLGNGITRFLAR